MSRLALSVTAFVAFLVVGRLAAGPLPVGIVGDSISDPYRNYQGALNPETGLPFWGSTGSMNWVELTTRFDRGAIAPIYNYAQAGFTGPELLAAGGPADNLAQSVTNNGVRSAVVQFGANDILDFLGGTAGSDPTAVVGSIAGSLDAILGKVQAAGPANSVVVNVPDLAVTPALQYLLGGTPGALAQVTALVQATNDAINQVAAAHGLAVVDAYGLSRLTTDPIVLGNTTIPATGLFAPDGFHPGTGMQALLGNTIWEALGSDYAGFILNDKEVLKALGLESGTSLDTDFYDVSPYVLRPTIQTVGGDDPTVAETPEPATVALAGVGLGIVGLRRMRRVNKAA